MIFSNLWQSFRQKFKWEDGRQGTGYEKICILQSRRLKCDMYLLRFREGAYIAPHVDSVAGGRHYRLNIFIKPAKVGGIFECTDCIIRNRLFVLFRPDIYRHSVSEVLSGTRYVVSFGIVR